MCANFPEKDNKLHFNGCSDRKLVLSDPSAFGVIYLHDYFHKFTYFIEFIMTFFSKTLKLVVATLLPVQATSVPCEHIFSSAKYTDTTKRNRISPVLMETLQMLKH